MTNLCILEVFLKHDKFGRKHCIAFVEWKPFDYFILLTIMVSPNCHNFKNPSLFHNCQGAMVHNFNLDLFHKFKAKSLFSHKKATRMLVLEMHPYVEMNLHSNLSFSSFSSSELQKATTLHTLSLHNLSIGHILTKLIGMKRLKNLNIGKYCSIFFI